MKRIRILTYNVQTGKHIDNVIDWLNRQVDIDIICLQEFPKDKIKEAIYFLGRVTYGYSFAKGFTFRKRMFGELILYRKDHIVRMQSKQILLGINKIESRVLRTTIPRSCLQLRCTIYKRPITIVNVHLVALALNAQKFVQLQRVIESLKKVRTPIIFLGDFNIPSLLGKKRLIRIIRNEGFHVHPKRILTHRVGVIRHQFDYVFSKGCTIIDQKAERVKFSDHFPVFAVLSIA